MSDLEFYRSRSEEMRKIAAETDLMQVRERCERAAEAFDKLADHALRTEVTRAREKERRAEAGEDDADRRCDDGAGDDRVPVDVVQSRAA